MKVHLVTHSYPSESRPYYGTFVRDHLKYLQPAVSFTGTVVQPFSFPFTGKNYHLNSSLLKQGHAQLNKLKYLSFPKRYLVEQIRENLSKKLLPVLKKDKPDLIHAQFLYPSGLVLSDIARAMPDTPLCLTIHGSDWYDMQKRPDLAKAAERSLREAHAIIAVGDGLKNDILSMKPGLGRKLWTIPNAVDEELYDTVSNDRKQELCKKLGLKKDHLHILCVANIRKVKGVDILLETWKTLDWDGYATLHLIGRPDDKELANQVRKFIPEKKNLSFEYHGPLSPKELRSFYQACDLFVSPSRREAFGIALIEALACGLPAVATRSGGPEEIIKENNGILCANRDSNALQRSLLKLMNNKHQYDSEKMHNEIVGRYGSETYRANYLTLYHRLIKADLSA